MGRVHVVLSPQRPLRPRAGEIPAPVANRPPPWSSFHPPARSVPPPVARCPSSVPVRRFACWERGSPRPSRGIAGASRGRTLSTAGAASGRAVHAAGEVRVVPLVHVDGEVHVVAV